MGRARGYPFDDPLDMMVHQLAEQARSEAPGEVRPLPPPHEQTQSLHGHGNPAGDVELIHALRAENEAMRDMVARLQTELARRNADVDSGHFLLHQAHADLAQEVGRLRKDMRRLSRLLAPRAGTGHKKKPRPLSKSEVKRARQLAAAHARACKRVGFGRGCVNTDWMRERMRASARQLELGL